jgi:hypothetical protein
MNFITKLTWSAAAVAVALGVSILWRITHPKPLFEGTAYFFNSDDYTDEGYGLIEVRQEGDDITVAYKGDSTYIAYFVHLTKCQYMERNTHYKTQQVWVVKKGKNHIRFDDLLSDEFLIIFDLKNTME